MHLRQALDQVGQIQQQMAHATLFRGYRALTIGFSGVLGIVAAIAQGIWMPQPAANIDLYVGLWCGVAAVSLIVVGGGMWIRTRRTSSVLARRHTLAAIESFAPCIVVGALVTFAMLEYAAGAAWMLPGLWALLFSLGVFASQRLLPRPILCAGLYYLIGGVVCLRGGNVDSLSPWSMGLVFGGGQLLTAAILYWTLERGTHGREIQTDE